MPSQKKESKILGKLKTTDLRLQNVTTVTVKFIKKNQAFFEICSFS